MCPKTMANGDSAASEGSYGDVEEQDVSSAPTYFGLLVRTVSLS